jgi:Flp pilus assembly protein TadG
MPNEVVQEVAVAQLRIAHVGWRRRPGFRALNRRQRGQSLVEFALAVPVFLLLIFGIIQAALIYRAYVALGQAATDGANVLAVQASQLPPNTARYQADAAGLAAMRAALSGMNLSAIKSIDIEDLSSADTPVVVANVTASADLVAGNSASNVTLENTYVPQAPSGITPCSVDQFYLANPLRPSPPWQSDGPGSTTSCAVPWNGAAYDATQNQNGRNAQRCSEDRLAVKIVYHYFSITFPVRYSLDLVTESTATLEPREFENNSAIAQSTALCS